nr:hypothetical protein [Tanacetum cinerariifolium]
MIRNYMPSRPDVEIDYSKFTYGPKQTSVDESDAKTSEYTSCKSDSSVETTTSMPAPVENEPKVICEPKVCTDAPTIEDYESDSNDDSVSNVRENKENSIFAFTDFVKHVKPSRENVKETGTTNHCHKVEKHDRNGHTRKGLGYAFTRKGYCLRTIKDCSRLGNQKATKESQKIERKIKARTPGMTLFKIGNFKRKSLDKENVSKQGRYLKTVPIFEESDFDNIDDMVDEDYD